MSKKTLFDSLIISEKAYSKALRYSLSLNEVGFLFFGKGNRILDVLRIKNVHSNKSNRFAWDRVAYREAVIFLKSNGYDLVIEGHSHSKDIHLRRPSRDDINYFKKEIHIIVFPVEKILRAWIIKSTIRDTAQAEVRVRLM